MELFEHQKTGIAFLKKKKKAILADEMGLGKTRQAIIAAGEAGGSILVICPASLKINWKREIATVYPDQEDAVIVIDSQTDMEMCGRWNIINYDILEKKIEWIECAIKTGGLKTLILDEAHYIKGKSIRAAVVTGGRVKMSRKGVTQTAEFGGIAKQMENVYCLTGTPLLNRPIELFNLLKAIGHDLGRVRSYYSRRYCGGFLKTIIRRAPYPPIRYFDESGATNLSELKRNLDGWMLRRKKMDVLDLPPKIVSIMECELSSEWQKSYDRAWTDYLAFLAENPDPERNMDGILMARHLVEITKLKQICSQSKIDRMAADIRNTVEQGQKVIVFSQYTETIRRLKDVLSGLVPGSKKDGSQDPVRCVTLTGADNMDERQKAVDDFQKGFADVFIANIKAGGVGLTLTEASIVMFADMEWSPEIHAQAEDRAHRIGQAGTVNVYYYIAADTIERDIVDILNSKKDVMNQILEGKASSKKGESMQEAFLKIMAKKAAGE